MYPSVNGTPITEHQLARFMPILAKRENTRLRKYLDEQPNSDGRTIPHDATIMHLLETNGPMTLRDLSMSTPEISYTSIIYYCRKLSQRGLITRDNSDSPWRLVG